MLLVLVRFNGSQNILLRINSCPRAVWSFVPDTKEKQRVHYSLRPRQDTERAWQSNYIIWKPALSPMEFG